MTVPATTLDCALEFICENFDMWKCTNCGQINGPYNDNCRKCRASKKKFASTDEEVLKELQEMGRSSPTPIGTRLRQWFEIDKPVGNAEESDSSIPSSQSKSPEYFISILRICGKIYLTASILVGALSILGFLSGVVWVLGVGAGFIFQGYVFYALLNVFGLVLENLIAIRELLSSKNKQANTTVAADNDSAV